MEAAISPSHQLVQLDTSNRRRAPRQRSFGRFCHIVATSLDTLDRRRAANVLDRQFTADQPNRNPIADFTNGGGLALPMISKLLRSANSR